MYLACLKAVSGDPQDALGLLAAMKGFRRPALLEQDQDLQSVRRLPGYPQLLKKLKQEGRAARREQREEEDEGAEG